MVRVAFLRPFTLRLWKEVQQKELKASIKVKSKVILKLYEANALFSDIEG